MKIGIVSFAHHHAEAYVQGLRDIPGVDLIGFSDEDPVRGLHYANETGARFYPSVEALLSATPDAVIVCSENSKHREHVELAAAAGVHILCEKPLATNLADSQAIVTACRRAGVRLMTAFPMRFSPPLQQVKERLVAGDLGRPFCLNSTNQGQMPKVHRDWFVIKELAGGGALMDHIVHLADIFNWFFGRDVAAVYAQSNHILHADTVDVETGGLVMITYGNGLFASIDCSWSKPLNYPTWGGLKMELISERGLTIVDGFSQNLNVYRQQPAGHQWSYWGSDANRLMLEEFVSAIRDEREPAVTGDDGHFALAVVMAAYRSAAENRAVPLQL